MFSLNRVIGIGVFMFIMTGIAPTSRAQNASQGWISFVFADSEDSDYMPVVILLNPEDGTTRILAEYEQTQLYYANLTWAPDGNSLVFETFDGIYRLWLDGTIQPLLLERSEFVNFLMPNPPLDASGAYRYPSWSPDSQKIAFVHSDVDFASQDSSRYLYVLDATSPQEQKLADLRPLADVSIFESVSYGLSWSPDGQEITFIANYPGSHTLYRLNVESGVTSVITQQYNPSSTVWTPDGQWILFNSSERSPQENIYRIRPDGSDLQPLLQSEGWFISGKIYLSPDGQRIAFWGFDSGGENLPVEWQFHLYSMRVDGSDLHELAAVGNLFFGPVWSPDSSQIAFTDDCEGEPNNEFYRCLYRVNAAGGELELLKEGGIYHNDTLGWALAPGF